MELVGLTGGIGSGKSTVAGLLADLGCDVIDADEVAREIVEPGQPALDELAERFGRGILTADGALDRAGLARLAFADDASRADLDRITHPRVAARIAERVAQIAAEEDPDEPRLVVVDHPLLIETRQAARFDAVIVVMADVDTRLERLRDRGMDPDDAQRRMSAQADDDERLAGATHVIDNTGGLDDLRSRVADVHADLVASAQRSPST